MQLIILPGVVSIKLNGGTDDNLSVILRFSHDLYIVFIYLYDVGLIIFVCIHRCCMFVLTCVYNCTCVCIMCLDNSFGVSTMNNTMYLH